jgi:hypothetical protein
MQSQRQKRRARTTRASYLQASGTALKGLKKAMVFLLNLIIIENDFNTFQFIYKV